MQEVLMVYEFLFKSVRRELFYDQSAHLMQEEEIAITSYSSPVFLFYRLLPKSLFACSKTFFDPAQKAGLQAMSTNTP